MVLLLLQPLCDKEQPADGTDTDESMKTPCKLKNVERC